MERILELGSDAVSKADRRISMVTEDERKYIEEWHRQLAEFDRAQRIKEAEKKGLEKGLKEGLEKLILSLLTRREQEIPRFCKRRDELRIARRFIDFWNLQQYNISINQSYNW